MEFKVGDRIKINNNYPYEIENPNQIDIEQRGREGTIIEILESGFFKGEIRVKLKGYYLPGILHPEEIDSVE